MLRTNGVGWAQVAKRGMGLEWLGFCLLFGGYGPGAPFLPQNPDWYGRGERVAKAAERFCQCGLCPVRGGLEKPRTNTKLSFGESLVRRKPAAEGKGNYLPSVSPATLGFCVRYMIFYTDTLFGVSDTTVLSTFSALTLLVLMTNPLR